MLQVLGFTKDNIIATKANGNLSEQDVRKIHPLIHNIIDRGQKVRWYFEMEKFTGYELQAFWEDAKMDLTHANDYEKIAMVGEKEWQNWITQFMRPFTQADIQYFDLSEKEKAKAWISQ